MNIISVSGILRNDIGWGYTRNVNNNTLFIALYIFSFTVQWIMNFGCVRTVLMWVLSETTKINSEFIYFQIHVAVSINLKFYDLCNPKWLIMDNNHGRKRKIWPGDEARLKWCRANFRTPSFYEHLIVNSSEKIGTSK